MRVLTLTDGEVAGMIAPLLRARLKEAGFVSGASSDDHTGFYFPIALDLAGEINIVRHEDGTWVFTQTLDTALAERMNATEAIHSQAIVGASAKFFQAR